MTWPEAWDLVWKGLTLVGGVAVIAAGVASYVGKLYADRSIEKHKAALNQETERLKAELAKDAETHKWNLRKKEILFQKEIEAASAFFELHRKLEPSYRHPDMDYDEAMEDVVESFRNSEDELTKFIAKHGPVLSTKNRLDLDECKRLASIHQFAPQEGGMKVAGEAAAEFLKKLQAVEARFVEELRV